jgi:hypothetical protein
MKKKYLLGCLIFGIFVFLLIFINFSLERNGIKQLDRDLFRFLKCIYSCENKECLDKCEELKVEIEFLPKNYLEKSVVFEVLEDCEKLGIEFKIECIKQKVRALEDKHPYLSK